MSETATETTTEIKDFVPTEFVCKGFSYQDGKMYLRLHRLSDAGELTAEDGGLYEYDKTFSGMHCGSIYRIPATDKKIRVGQKQFVGHASEVSALAQFVDGWQIESKAAETLKSRAHQEKKAGEISNALHSLDDLRRVYRATNHEGRLAIEVRLLDYLRRGVR